MTFLLRYWKLIAMLVAVLAVIAALRLYGVSQYREGEAHAKVELQAQIEREREAQRVIREEVEREHEVKVSALQGRVSRLMRGTSVRLCEPSDPLPGAASEPIDDPADGSALRAGRDIGAELVQYGGQCEQLRQQLIALKSWYSRG